MDWERLTDKKKVLDAHRPLAEELTRNLDDWFRVELTYTSNAIEGNTLTRRETALVVEKGVTVGGKTLSEHLEATNHASALDWVRGQVGRKPRRISLKDILHIHATILRGIDDANAGRFRSIAVRIAGSRTVLPNPAKIPSLMKRFVAWFNGASDLHAAELAAEAHYRLVTIHPFVDGNGRTARLLMNMILLMRGYPAAIIRKRDRLAYIGALEQAQAGGAKDDYYRIIRNAIGRSLDIYLRAIKGAVALDLTGDGGLLKIGQLAQAAGETPPTIRHWVECGLIRVAERTPSGYQMFPRGMIERAKTIRKWQAKRLTLAEIKKKLTDS